MGIIENIHMKKYEEIKPLYDKIFKDINGYGISLLERENKKDNKIFRDVLYGEVSLELLYALYVLPPLSDYISAKKIFYDLGSGIGNAVISSYLTGNFDKCVGVELLDSLYETSIIAKNRLCNIDKQAENKVNFIHDNILNIDFSDADLILFCCPTKNEEIRRQIEHKFDNLKKGTIILSLIHKFDNSNSFELLNAKLVKVVWGETPLFTYIKK